MPSYIFVKKPASVRGYTYSIVVYKIVNNKPEFLGSKDVNAASFKGDTPTAHNIIAEKENFKTDGYFIKRKDVFVREV